MPEPATPHAAEEAKAEPNGQRSRERSRGPYRALSADNMSEILDGTLRNLESQRFTEELNQEAIQAQLDALRELVEDPEAAAQPSEPELLALDNQLRGVRLRLHGIDAQLETLRKRLAARRPKAH